MEKTSSDILLIGSDVSISNLPIKEVSLLTEGALPAYGYNPGDFIELLAGPVKVEAGRLEQCQTWLKANFTAIDEAPRHKTYSYGTRKKVYQIFRKREKSKTDASNQGWFMFQQILPPEGRSKEPPPIIIDESNKELFTGNCGLIIIDDSGRPPELAEELKELNGNVWAIGMGISVVNWQNWAKTFGDDFCLFCRLADLETTRMEMDSSIIWESLVAMSIRALKSNETKLWDDNNQRFLCHIIVEMFPHGILYLGPDGIFFRHRKLCLPNKSSSRRMGAVPCYDTMVTSLLATDWINHGKAILCRNYFFDFSKRVMDNWQQLTEEGYHFDNGLEFPKLKRTSSLPAEAPCSIVEDRPDPYFIELPKNSNEFDQLVDITACQTWNAQKKKALRSFFPIKSPYATTLQAVHGIQYNYLNVILEVLHHLKEEVSWKRGFDELRLFSVGNLRTTDPVEIEPIKTLQNVMDSYVSRETFHRPLCVGVFGPPGSGKSFSVKEVARMIAKKFDSNPFDFFEFNMTQFENPEEINSAIEPIRASVAKGKVPIVFWDEFDCQYDNNEFGYLRYFLPSMQDGVTYVHGTPYNIGRSIFVFAGGIKSSWEDMENLLNFEKNENAQLAKTLKIPDFMSRLRVVIDIDGIGIPEHFFSGTASAEDLSDLRRILLKRAFIIAHQMDTHWKKAARKTSGLLLRLLIAEFKFGARSIEAVIEASGAADRLVYGLPELIAPSAARIHANWRIGLEREVDQIRKQQQIRAIW